MAYKNSLSDLTTGDQIKIE